MAGLDLVGRDHERRGIVDRVLDARNVRLEGPRRFGKTSLVRAALADSARVAGATVEVNFLGCVTASDVAERIERAYARSLQGPLRRWFEGLVRTLRPTLSATPGGVGVSVTPTGGPGLLDRLSLPRRLHERTGAVTVVAFDEFQEVLRIDSALPGVFRSELETHGTAAGYLFSGSHPGMMRDLFADRRHAFFAQAAPIAVGSLAADVLAEAIDSRFRERRRDPGEALGPLLDTGQGHPQRSMLLAHHLFSVTPSGGAADGERWSRALAAAQREVEAEVVAVWDQLSDLERRIAKAVASREVALTEGAARTRFGLSRGGSVSSAVRRLTNEGILLGDEGRRAGVRLVDPMLELWLAER